MKNLKEIYIDKMKTFSFREEKEKIKQIFKEWCSVDPSNCEEILGEKFFILPQKKSYRKNQ